MFSRRLFVALAVALMMGSTAMAGGGGGTKRDATIVVRNDTNTQIAAFIDLTPAQIAALGATPTVAAINAAGGKVINPGQTASFLVRGGTYTLSAGSNLPPGTANATTSVTIGRGAKKHYAFTPGNALVAY